MNGSTFYSHKLNLIVDYLDENGAVEDVLEIKAVSARAGYVFPDTRVLAFVAGDMPITIEDMRVFGERLVKELPEYAGTKTAVVTREARSTAGAIKASKDLAENQTIDVFSTLERALLFLDLRLSEIEGEFPHLKSLFEKYND